MKICVISSSVFPCPPLGYSGLEAVAWHCASGLAKRGHCVTLIAPLGSYCDGVEVLGCLPPGWAEEQAYGGAVFKDGGGQDVRWPGYWSKLLEFNNGGVIIDHSWQKWAYMLKAEGRLTAPVMGVYHAPVNTMYQSLPPVEKPCAVCISNDQRSHFEALFSPRQARTCHNGIDMDFYKPTNMPRTDRFLFLARYSTIKGADLAIKYCAQLGLGLDAIGDVSITNEPQYYEQCKQLANGSSKVSIRPGVPRGETVWWYSQAHCFLHPNMRFREPLGLAPLEAQACGLPVIAWDYGAMRETVKHKETGWLIRDELEFSTSLHAAANSRFSVDTRNKCREWAGNFSLGHMVNRYEELCIEALDTGGW